MKYHDKRQRRADQDAVLNGRVNGIMQELKKRPMVLKPWPLPHRKSSIRRYAK